MKTPKFKRNAKFWGIEATNELVEIQKETTKVLNEISAFVRKMIVNGDIIKIIPEKHKMQMSPAFIQNFTPKNPPKNPRINNEITDTELKNMCSEIFKKYESPNAKIENYKRSLVKNIMERYASQENRNRKKKIPTIRMQQDKTMYFKDNSVEIDSINKTLSFKTLRGTIKVQYPKSKKENELINHIKNKEKKRAKKI
jgi:hypothetical protein